MPFFSFHENMHFIVLHNCLIKIFVVKSYPQKLMQKNKQERRSHPCFQSFYFLGFGGLFPAGPPGLPVFVLGLGF